MQCEFIKSDKKRCNANAVNDHNFCYFHSGKTKFNLKNSAAKGGKTPKKVFKPLSPVNINKPTDILNLLGTVICEVRSGDIDVRVANCLGFLSSHMLKAFEVCELEDRLKKVEEAISNKK